LLEMQKRRALYARVLCQENIEMSAGHEVDHFGNMEKKEMG
jgi:hypothetical protein